MRDLTTSAGKTEVQNAVPANPPASIIFNGFVTSNDRKYYFVQVKTHAVGHGASLSCSVFGLRVADQ